MTREDAQLLPVIQWDGREFLVDVGARRFRNVDDARDFIDMHSKKGRAIVRQMQDAEWRVFAVALSSTPWAAGRIDMISATEV